MSLNLYFSVKHWNSIFKMSSANWCHHTS